jgi:hypothetical protein
MRESQVRIKEARVRERNPSPRDQYSSPGGAGNSTLKFALRTHNILCFFIDETGIRTPSFCFSIIYEHI